MASFQSFEQLTTLRDLLKETLSALPGFRSLSIFGSVAEGRADGYSDLDMIVETDDLMAAKAELPGLLEQVGPVEFCWTMNLRPNEWNPTVVFRDRGYYHKLDLGLVDSSSTDRAIPRDQTVLLVEGGGERETFSFLQSQAYVPEHGSIGHFLLGMLIGGTRYLKARRRGQHMTCYRFVTAAADWRARLFYASVTGELSLSSKLSTDEYRALDKLATDHDRLSLLATLDYSSPDSMDRAMYSVLQYLYEHARILSEKTGEILPNIVFDRFMRFFAAELS